jgi:chorismate mutase
MLTQKAIETGMSQEFIEKVFKAIHEESIEVQNNIMINR